MNRTTSWLTVLPSLIIPTCLGLVMYLGMSAMLERHVITNDIIIRYLTGHPVSTATLILFFIGVGSLLMIATNVFGQWGAANRIHFRDPASAQSEAETNTLPEREVPGVQGEAGCVELAIEFGHQLLKMPKRFHEHYLWHRLHESLHFVHRTGSAKGLESETKYLSEMDLDQQQQRYSLVRILIWATPMLGFLGTVLGISQALGGIDVGPENNFQEMMNGLRSSLYVAFDTTALALVLSMALMFGQFLVDHIELQLLKFVDYRTRQELSARFDMSAASEFDAVEKMGLAVLATADQLVHRQSELWSESIRAAESVWEDSITGVNERVRDNLAFTLDQTVEKMTSTIGTTIQKADDSMAHRWQQWQVTLSDSARCMKEQQRELNSQTRLIKDLVDSVAIKLLASEDLQLASTVDSTLSNPAGQSEPASPDVSTEHQQIPTETIAPPDSERTPLGLFNPEQTSFDDAPSLEVEISEQSTNMPRYRYAEELAGVEPVVMFPVQIDAKKAA